MSLFFDPRCYNLAVWELSIITILLCVIIVITDNLCQGTLYRLEVKRVVVMLRTEYVALGWEGPFRALAAGWSKPTGVKEERSNDLHSDHVSPDMNTVGSFSVVPRREFWPVWKLRIHNCCGTMNTSTSATRLQNPAISMSKECSDQH